MVSALVVLMEALDRADKRAVAALHQQAEARRALLGFLQETRKAKRIGLRAIAARAGCSTSTLSNIERGVYWNGDIVGRYVAALSRSSSEIR